MLLLRCCSLLREKTEKEREKAERIDAQCHENPEQWSTGASETEYPVQPHGNDGCMFVLKQLSLVLSRLVNITAAIFHNIWCDISLVVPLPRVFESRVRLYFLVSS